MSTEAFNDVCPTIQCLSLSSGSSFGSNLGSFFTSSEDIFGIQESLVCHIQKEGRSRFLALYSLWLISNFLNAVKYLDMEWNSAPKCKSCFWGGKFSNNHFLSISLNRI